MATAKNRAIDQVRRRKLLESKRDDVARVLEARGDADSADLDRRIDEEIWRRAGEDATGETSGGDVSAGGGGDDDDLLRLVFMACHPVLSTEARVALTLRLVGGLTTAEIARASLAPESTIAQRIVRAKRTLSQERVPFEVPGEAELPERVASVLEVIY